MAVQVRSIRKKDEIRCQRCNGRMAYEKFYGENDSFFAWRCVICGDILDPVILLHRLSQDAQVVVPEKEEEVISLIRKYLGAKSKPVNPGGRESRLPGRGNGRAAGGIGKSSSLH